MCRDEDEVDEQLEGWTCRAGFSPNNKRFKMHPAITHVLEFFKFDHLPEHLQEVSKPFAELAQKTAERAPDNQETTVALRKLLEAKDAAVRACLNPATTSSQETVAEAAKRGFRS